QFAGAVAQGAGAQVDALAAGDFTVLVIQVTQVVDAQRAGGGNQAGAVIQVAGGHTEVDGNGAAQQRAILVVQAGAVDVQRGRGVDQALILVIQLTVDIQVEVSAAGQGAAAVVQAGGLNVEGRSGDQAFDVGQRLID